MPSSVQFGWALLKEKTKLTLAVKQAHLKVFCSELGHPANIETRPRRGARKERENDGFAFNHALIGGLSHDSLNGLGAGGSLRDYSDQPQRLTCVRRQTHQG